MYWWPEREQFCKSGRSSRPLVFRNPADWKVFVLLLHMRYSLEISGDIQYSKDECRQFITLQNDLKIQRMEIDTFIAAWYGVHALTHILSLSLSRTFTHSLTHSIIHTHRTVARKIIQPKSFTQTNRHCEQIHTLSRYDVCLCICGLCVLCGSPVKQRRKCTMLEHCFEELRKYNKIVPLISPTTSPSSAWLLLLLIWIRLRKWTSSLSIPRILFVHISRTCACFWVAIV